MLARVDYFITRDNAFPLGTKVEGVEGVEPAVLWNLTTEDEELRLSLVAQQQELETIDEQRRPR